MTRSARAAALRSTALATSLALAMGLSAFTVEAVAKTKVPLPKPRPIARNLVPTQTAKNTAAAASPAPAAPALAPAPRQPAALPPPPRKPSVPAAIAATSSTSQADTEALENVIELVRKRKPADATQAQAAISDPVAKKLAEWIILRSDDNGASVERYRAFLSANPSWPSQTFLRRRIEAALWDDRRDDATIWAWFENESPRSAKGKFSLARAMIARGDRANAERLVRSAWRTDSISEDTENAALDLFGALITPGDHKARMDFLLYGKETAAALRAAKRLGANQVALAKARIAANNTKAGNAKALLNAVPGELHGDPGYIFSKIQLLRRDEKFAEAAQLMLSVPKDPGRLHNLDEWWIERRLLSRKLLDTGETRNAYLIARDAALPARDIYQTEQQFTAGWIALRFLNDPATAAQHFARIGVGSVNPTALARAGYWQGRAAEAAGRTPGSARGLHQGGRAIDQLLWPAGARQARTAADRIERRPRRPVAGNREAGNRPRGAAALSARRTRTRDPHHGRPRRKRRSGCAGWIRRTGVAQWRRARHAAARQGCPQPRTAVRSLCLSGGWNSAVQVDRARGRTEHRLRHRPAGERLQSERWSRRRRPMG